MAGRGEAQFTRLPRFGASLYDWFLGAEPIHARVAEVARFLVSRMDQGRLLDIGMGPGRLLAEIHRLRPGLELFGLDISSAMVQRATENLKGVPADLRAGTIRHTDYESDFFDAATCIGSFYLWDHPEDSLQEIFRILKPGRSAFLFETRRDYDETAYRNALRNNLRKLDLIRRMLGPAALGKALRMSYHTGELAGILARTSFSKSYQIENVILSGLPVWVRITATKIGAGPDPAAQP